MAVTLAVYDLQQPTGELDCALYPNADSDELIDGWLTQAIEKVTAAGVGAADQNNAAAAWVYYRGYAHVAQRLASEPASVALDSTITRSIASDQRKYFAGLADLWLNACYGYSLITPVATVPAFTRPVRIGVY